MLDRAIEEGRLRRWQLDRLATVLVQILSQGRRRLHNAGCAYQRFVEQPGVQPPGPGRSPLWSSGRSCPVHRYGSAPISERAGRAFGGPRAQAAHHQRTRGFAPGAHLPRRSDPHYRLFGIQPASADGRSDRRDRFLVRRMRTARRRLGKRVPAPPRWCGRCMTVIPRSFLSFTAVSGRLCGLVSPSRISWNLIRARRKNGRRLRAPICGSRPGTRCGWKKISKHQEIGQRFAGVEAPNNLGQEWGHGDDIDLGPRARHRLIEMAAPHR